MPSNISIQQATEADAPTILSIVLEAFEQYRHTVIPTPSVFRETEQAILNKLSLGGGFVAYVNDVAVGCVLYETRDTYVYLGRLGVLPEYRQYGIGRQLMQTVEEKAEQLQYMQVRLNVRIGLAKNHRLFESVGYTKIAEYCHDGFDEPTYIEMAKDLER